MNIEEYTCTTKEEWRKWLDAIINGERTEKPTRSDLICIFHDLFILADLMEECTCEGSYQ